VLLVEENPLDLGEAECGEVANSLGEGTGDRGEAMPVKFNSTNISERKG
jgi:hypothetical protein